MLKSPGKSLERAHLHCYKLCLGLIHCCPSASWGRLCRSADNDERAFCCVWDRYRWTFKQTQIVFLSIDSVLHELRTSGIEVAVTIFIADGDCMRLRNGDRLDFRKNFIVVDVLPVLAAVGVRTTRDRWEANIIERTKAYSRFEINPSAKYRYSSGREERSCSRFSMYSGNAETYADQRRSRENWSEDAWLRLPAEPKQSNRRS